MPLPASLIASIVSAIIETAVDSHATNTSTGTTLDCPSTMTANSRTSTSTPAKCPDFVEGAMYETYIINRTLPPEAMRGVMLPPQGDGTLIINGKELALSPAIQFRNQKNLIVMPMTIQDKKDIIYLTNASGAVHRVWMLTPAEISALKKSE